MHILFYISFTNFILFLLTSIYLVEKIKKSKAAILLVFLYLSFAVWCFASGFFYLSQTATEAFFWFRLSSIGWLMFPALTLHFYIQLASSLQKNRLSKKMMLIYITPVFFISIEFIFKQNLIQSEIVQSSLGLGWAMKISADHFLYYSYIFYVLSYVCSGMFFLSKWSRGMTQAAHKNHSRKVMFVTAVVLVISFTFDLIIPLFSVCFPPVSNLFLVFLLASTIFHLNEYDVFEAPGFVAYRTIINSLEDLVILFDADYKFFSISPAVTALLGYTMDDLKGKELTYILYNQTYNYENAELLAEKNICMIKRQH